MKVKQKRRYKPYNLFVLWKTFEDIVVSRIRYGLKGRLDTVADNPEMFKLFTLIR